MAIGLFKMSVTKQLLIIGVVGLVGTFLYLGLERSHDSHGKSLPEKPPKSNVKVSDSIVKSSPVSPKDRRIKELVCELAELTAFTKENVRDYLALRGINSKSLTAVYWLSSDYETLVKLTECAGDSLPAISTLATELREPSDRLFWAEKLIALDPSSKSGYFCKMQALVKMGDFPAALKVLQQANAANKFNQYEAEKILDQQEAWQTVGASAISARIRVERNGASAAALARQTAPAINEIWKNMIANGDENQALDEATSFLSSAAALSKSSQYSEESKLTALTAEKKILQLLPLGVEYGETGMTVDQRINEIKKQSTQIMVGWEDLKTKLTQASSDTVDLYYQRVDSLGREAAQKWILEQ
jgi:tetratricopeptide (TPR) repeat protein